MFRSVFFRRLFVPHVVLICVATGAVGIFAGLRLRGAILDERRKSLHDDLQLITELIDDDLDAGRLQRVSDTIALMGKRIGCRITVIAADGRVLADNQADPAKMENHLSRPEIIAAASAGEASQIRGSGTIHQDLLYLAQRIKRGERVYYLRLAVWLRDLDRELWLLYSGLAAAAVFAMAAAALISYQFARWHARPIVELTSLADALSRGDLDRRTALSGKQRGEIETLGSALNRMAQSLQDLLAATARDKAEVLAILSSMSEGVIATDVDQHVVVVNNAAGQLLGFAPDAARGKPLGNAVRIDWILKAAGEVLASREKRVFPAGLILGRHLEIALVPYPPQGPLAGLVLVAHDATETVRYQELRKEFVANASHELRTPLTVIKGYIETLRDGAIDDRKRAADYLAILDRHSTQLANLVDDLLALSRLESQGVLPRRGRVDLAAVAGRAVEMLTSTAARKKHSLQADLQAVPAVLGNADYLERAISNLLDNAIKYTPDGGQIKLTVRKASAGVEVTVADNGIGIPASDLPRIFERFYRVDRSRSREMGGTGLGLSIVKHIVQSHGGTVDVRSEPGKGSTFWFIIPISGDEIA